jgi:glycosyltransferase involved in cell wall biosynthesis
VKVQTVGDYFGRMDMEVRMDVVRLKRIGYAGLRTDSRALEDDAYRRMFEGSVCLQLYDPRNFADRVSGVMLDAMSARAPVITHEGTWMARHVARYEAGRVVPVDDQDELLKAVQDVVEDYDRYSMGAERAARSLARAHDPRRLVEAVLDLPVGERGRTEGRP